jgi:transcriptional regulator with XRE-family HTH domain
VNILLLRKQFGQRLRQLRKARNLTQERLAELTDLSKDQISFLERGLSGTTLDRMGVLAEALNVPLKDLLDFEQCMESTDAR